VNGTALTVTDKTVDIEVPSTNTMSNDDIDLVMDGGWDG